MRHLITAAILTVATMTGVQAKPPSGGQSSSKKIGSGKHADFKNAGFKTTNMKQLNPKFNQIGSGKYVTQHGKKFSQGYLYSGNHHCHWSHSCYWPQYRCDCYYCPSTLVWYYWCQPRHCYLPVSCVEYARPTFINEATATATAVSNVNVNVNSAPVDLPPVLASGPGQPFKGGPVK